MRVSQYSLSLNRIPIDDKYMPFLLRSWLKVSHNGHWCRKLGNGAKHIDIMLSVLNKGNLDGNFVYHIELGCKKNEPLCVPWPSLCFESRVMTWYKKKYDIWESCLELSKSKLSYFEP